MIVRWLGDVRAEDQPEVGGKAASLGELRAADLPVPNGFVVTVDAYREMIDSANLTDDLAIPSDIDPENAEELNEIEERIAEAITGATVPDAVETAIIDAYDELADGFDEPPLVAVRSSATAEDLPDASFAGQQETYLNVPREELLERVVDCWTSLFTSRAISYRAEQGYDSEAISMAVVVQAMVDAEKSGVMFTADPNTGDDQFTIESAWGLGEGVVSGEVSPDTYVLEADGSLVDLTVAEKRRAYVLDRESGETVTTDIEDDRRTARVLSDDELARLVDLGQRIEAHYGQPQDVEWAIRNDEIYLLQSRNITTIKEEGMVDQPPGGADSDEVLVSGLAASPGRASGAVRIVTQIDQLDKVQEGDVIVTQMTTPDMVPAMKRAAAIVTDEGGLTSHASIVSRELGVPAITGTSDATEVLTDGQLITVNGDRGIITPTDTDDSPSTDADEPATQPKPTGQSEPSLTTATEVKVNISIPSAAERAAATGADGVGLLRLEHMVLEMGATPDHIITEGGPDAYTDELVDGIRTVADAFYPRPVRVRTLDAPTDEFRQLTGGENEPTEHNPMLGYRGIRRSLAEPDVFKHELGAFAELYELGYDNVEIMFPLVNDVDDVERALDILTDVGIDPDRQTWGVMIETPASALMIDELSETSLDFVSFGTNDLTQYTLAVDRNNERVADRYNAFHPAIRELIAPVIESCRERDIRTSICGEAGSQPAMVEFLVTEGISSISANIDAVQAVQQRIKRTEQRLLLDSVR